MTDAALRTTRLLIPLDGSPLAEQALPYAMALAAPAAEFVLVHVVADPEPHRDAGYLVATVDEVLTRAAAAAREELHRAAATWRLPANRTRIETANGDPATLILHLARTQDVGLIILASHGRGGLGRWVFGSVADRVARSAPVPVLIVRPRDAPVALGPVRFARLLVPLDGSSLAEQAVPVARDLARQLQHPVHLLRVIAAGRPGAPPGPALAPGAEQLAERDSATVREATEAYLAQTAAGLAQAGLAVTYELRMGSAAGAILDASRAGDLIILTSHGEGGLRRWLLGSVAEKLVRLAPAPVLLVRTLPPEQDG